MPPPQSPSSEENESTVASSLRLAAPTQFRELESCLLQPLPRHHLKGKDRKKTFSSPLRVLSTQSSLQKLNGEMFESCESKDSSFLALFEVLICLKVYVNLPIVQLCCDVLFHTKVYPGTACQPP